MPLSLAEMSNVSRHLRYPVIGTFRVNSSGQSMATATAVSYRYTQAYGMLLWRLNNLAANEECRITGKAYGSLIFVGPPANVGDTLTITFTGGTLSAPVSIVVTATQDLINMAQPKGNVQKLLVSQYFNANVGLGLCAQVAQQVALNPQLVAAGFVSNAPYGTGPYTQQAIPVPEVDITNPVPFTMTIQNTGQMSAQIQANGELLHPMISPNTQTAPIYGYLPILNYLETAYGNSTDILQIDKADVFTARKTVLAETFSLYQTWVMRMADYFGLPVNPSGTSNLKAATMRSYL